MGPHGYQPSERRGGGGGLEEQRRVGCVMGRKEDRGGSTGKSSGKWVILSLKPAGTLNPEAASKTGCSQH